jgi:hypothetical protein
MNEKNKLSLTDLIKTRSKRKVVTSVGPLYVRDFVYKDYKNILESGTFEEADARKMGLKAIQATTSTLSDPNERGGLDNKIFSALLTSDLDSLAIAALKDTNGLDAGDLVASLGRVYLDECAKLGQASKRISDQFKNSFSFLQPTTLASLAASVVAIDQSNQKWKTHFSDIGIESAALQAAEAEAVKFSGLNLPSSEERKFSPPVLDFYDTHEARAARASEQTVDILKQLATHLGEVKAHTASMYTTLVLEAIPQWMAQQESNKEQSERSLRSAASSLRWTKWAVITSIVTSLGIATYQQHSEAIEAAIALRDANERQTYWEKQSAEQQSLLNMQTQITQNLLMELKSLNSKSGKLPILHKLPIKQTSPKGTKNQSYR